MNIHLTKKDKSIPSFSHLRLVETVQGDRDFLISKLPLDHSCSCTDAEQTSTFHASRTSIKEQYTYFDESERELAVVYFREKDVAALKKIYEFSDTIAIDFFLKANPFLVDFLKEVFSKIRAAFGEEPVLFLELCFDPETGDVELFVVVRSEKTIDASFALLNDFLRDWFLDNMHRTKSLLSVTIEAV